MRLDSARAQRALARLPLKEKFLKINLRPAVDFVLERLGRGEARSNRRLDLEGLAGLGIATHPGSSRAWLKRAEAEEGHLFALRHAVRDRVKRRGQHLGFQETFIVTFGCALREHGCVKGSSPRRSLSS